MKQRLLVMNGRMLVQSEHAGQWHTETVEKAANVKPGIYAIYLATAADKGKVHDGPVLHINDAGVYQQVGKNFVLHERSVFPDIPELGANLSLRYSAGKCVATPLKKKTGRKMS